MCRLNRQEPWCELFWNLFSSILSVAVDNLEIQPALFKLTKCSFLAGGAWSDADRSALGVEALAEAVGQVALR